jgi:hypothetical protein
MIDLISVVFAEEIPLIQIQARSIDLYVPTELVDCIYIVVNDSTDICNYIQPSWWGRHKQKIKILHQNALSDLSATMHGWDAQQLLKLLMTARSKNNYAYVLDAKTWFVKPVKPELLFNEAGQANAKLMQLFDGFKSTAPFLTEFYGKSYRHIIGPGGVPFAFHTPSLRSMIQEVETKTNKAFDVFFCEAVQFPINITEFTLYSAYICSKNCFDKLYTYRQPYKVVNIAHFQTDEFEELFSQMRYQNTLTVSIHKNTYQQLSENQFQRWCQLLVDKNLFTDLENAQNQLNTFRKGVDNGAGIRL